MPAAVDISKRDREARATRLAQAVDATGLSRREVSRRIAKTRKVQPATIETNIKRWSGAARDGAIDAAPDWIFDEIAKIVPALPNEIERDLRAAIERGYVSMGLATRAADAIASLQKERA